MVKSFKYRHRNQNRNVKIILCARFYFKRHIFSFMTKNAQKWYLWVKNLTMDTKINHHALIILCAEF